MSCEIQITRRNEQSTSTWSGGSTTQLAIYPEDTKYQERNFHWRISTAVVEAEESEFTALPGFTRHLMILKGQMEIVHKGHHSLTLLPFQRDTFEGSWQTKSYGKAVDFNLMLAEGWGGDIIPLNFTVGGSASLNQDAGFYGVYCYDGEMQLNIVEEGLGKETTEQEMLNKQKIICLKEKDFALITLKKGQNLVINSQGKTNGVAACVKLL